jgi:hypothetical protein
MSSSPEESSSFIEKKVKFGRYLNAINLSGITTSNINNNKNYNLNTDDENFLSNKLGDKRLIDAADTLVSLANSATNTPTVESKPFVISNNIAQQLSGNSIEIVRKFLILSVIRL